MAGEVHHNEAESRYELAVGGGGGGEGGGGGTAVAAYRMEGDVVAFTHTVVPEELEGQGIASRLIEGALDDVRSRGLKIRPLCAFVQHYVEKHPGTSDLIAR